MSTPLQTPTRRPRPPAKARRSMVKRSTTPPPAYATATTFPFPTSETASNDSSTNSIDTTSSGIVPNTWGKEIPAVGDETQSDDLSWLNDKSRDELTNLLVQADALIKERENELSLTSAACKTLYENNVALKTKHEVLISRLPLPQNSPHNTYSSPSHSHSNSVSSPSMSPLIPRSPMRHSISLGRSASELGVAFSPLVGSSPEQMLSKSYNGYRPYKSHQRRPSVSTADISFLADQNAELLNKLEKLESEATSADLVGRRELKRLEKEITIMKEELEKTQLKSTELEEKTNKGFELGAKRVVEQVLKRERRISARRMSREVGSATFRDFAPQGSGFGLTGPKLSGRTDEEDEEMYEEEDTVSHIEQPAVQPDQLIVKLLEKIQELETTNTKILEQQTETTSRLQAVQRETEFMTKIYERISDAENNVLVDINEEEAVSRDRVSGELERKLFNSQLQSQLLAAKVKRQRSFHKNESKIRPSVINLFDDTEINISTPPPLPVPFPESGSSRHTSSYSIGSGGLASPALSSLSLNSPPRRIAEELSPLPRGFTLASEIGDKWGGSVAGSVRWNLSDFSSVPPSPSAMSGSLSVEGDENKTETLPTPRSVHSNSLQLSVEPPTPQKHAHISQQEASLIGNMSPRFRMTQTLRSRKTRRQRDSLYPDPFSPGPQSIRKFIEQNSPTPANMHNGGLLADAFEVMMEEFDVKNGGQEFTDYSRSPTPDIERLAYSRENSVDPEEKEPYNEENSLTTRSDNKVASSKFGGVMIEVWMWLQFVIIVLVFLWAMARRGPKSVLKTAERKRTLSMKIRS